MALACPICARSSPKSLRSGSSGSGETRAAGRSAVEGDQSVEVLELRDRHGDGGMPKQPERLDGGYRSLERDAQATIGGRGKRQASIGQRDVGRPSDLHEVVGTGQLGSRDVGQRCPQRPWAVPDEQVTPLSVSHVVQGVMPKGTPSTRVAGLNRNRNRRRSGRSARHGPGPVGRSCSRSGWWPGWFSSGMGAPGRVCSLTMAWVG